MKFRPFYLLAAASALFAGCVSPAGSPPPPQWYYIAEKGLNQIAVLDSKTDNIVFTAAVGTGPTEIVGDPSGVLWTNNTGSNSVTAFSGVSGKTFQTLPAGSDPEYMAMYGSLLFVANAGDNSVTVIDTAARTVKQTIALAGKPTSIGAGNGYPAVVVSEQGGALEVIDAGALTTNGATAVSGLTSAAAIPGSAANQITVGLAYSSGSAKVETLAASGVKVLSQPAIGAGAILADGRDPSVLYFLNQTTNQVTGVAPDGNVIFSATAGTAPQGAAYDNTMNKFLVANSGADSVSVIDPASGSVVHTIALPAGSHPTDVYTDLRYSGSGTPAATPTPTPGATATPTTAPTATPTPTTAPNTNPDTLFVADYSANVVDEFDAPLTDASTPSVQLTANAPQGVAAYGSTLATAWTNGAVLLYQLPLTSQNQGNPTVFTSSAGTNGMMAFDPAGNLWLTTESSTVLEYTPPFTSSTPAKTAGGFAQTNAVAFDSSANMYVANSGYGSYIGVMAPPYTSLSVYLAAPAGSTIQGIAISGSQLAAADAGTSHVLVYDLPLHAGDSPAYTIGTNGTPVGVAFDASGNLFVSDVRNRDVAEYLAPLSASSRETTVVSTPGSNSGPAQIAIKN